MTLQLHAHALSRIKIPFSTSTPLSFYIQLHKRGAHLLRMIQHHDPPPNYPPYIETQLDYPTPQIDSTSKTIKANIKYLPYLRNTSTSLYLSQLCQLHQLYKMATNLHRLSPPPPIFYLTPPPLPWSLKHPTPPLAASSNSQATMPPNTRYPPSALWL